MTGQKTVGDIINRFREAMDVNSALAVFSDEEKQGMASEQVEEILHIMLDRDDHGKKNMDVGIGSTAMWVLNAVQRQVVEHVLGAIFVATLQRPK